MLQGRGKSYERPSGRREHSTFKGHERGQCADFYRIFWSLPEWDHLSLFCLLCLFSLNALTAQETCPVTGREDEGKPKK